VKQRDHRVHDGGVDRREALLVGEKQGEAEELADEPRQAATGAEEERSSLSGDETGGRPSDREAVIEHRVEERRVGLGHERRVDKDALRQRSVLLEAEPASEARMADEPESEVVTAVEVETAQAVEFVEEVVAEALGLVEDDDRVGDAQDGAGRLRVDDRPFRA